MADLFRQEALAHQRQKLYGTILLARPLSFSILTALFAAIAAIIVAFFFMFGFTRKEVVPGVLLPDRGLIRVYPLQTGIVLERKVRDGQIVKEGDVLFVLSVEQASAALGDTQAAISDTLHSRIDSLNNELAQQRAQVAQQRSVLAERRLALLDEIKQIGAEIALQQKRVRLAEATAQRYADLHRSKYISDAQAQEQAADLLDQQARVHFLERSRASLKTELAALEGELRDLPLKAQREASSLQRGIAATRQDLAQSEARRRILVTAPQAGIVTTLAAEPGQSVSPHQPLAAILPVGSRLEAELYAPSRAIGFVKPGTAVLLRYQAFPYQKFGQYRGVVREISHTALQPNEIVLPRAYDPGATEPLYRIRVSLDQQSVKAYGQPEPLKVGMQLDASLVLERRKLYEWVVEPLYSVTGRL